MEEKSLERWRFELKSIGKKHWLVFYESFMGHPPDRVRLYRALTLYGEWAVLEAIVDASTQTLTGNGTNYVVATARNKFKESQKEIDAVTEYVDAIEESKKNTRNANKVLEDRLRKRAKRK